MAITEGEWYNRYRRALEDGDEVALDALRQVKESAIREVDRVDAMRYAQPQEITYGRRQAVFKTKDGRYLKLSLAEAILASIMIDEHAVFQAEVGIPSAKGSLTIECMDVELMPEMLELLGRLKKLLDPQGPPFEIAFDEIADFDSDRHDRLRDHLRKRGVKFFGDDVV